MQQFPRPLWWAATASIALHCALLLGWIAPHLSGESEALVSSANRPVIRVQLVNPVSADSTAVATQNTPSPAQPPAPSPAAAQVAAPESASKAAATRSAATGPAEAQPAKPEAARAAAPATPVVPPVAANAAPSLPPAPAYRAEGLDPAPRPITDIDPEYPAAAGQQEGTVVLRILIDSSGNVENVAVVRATPAGTFDASAIAAFSAARFSPGYFLGRPVKSQITIAVDYTPTNRGNAVSGAR